MSVVKHTPSTDALETLGNIIHPGEKRDAIHLAVDPAFSRGYLLPGDHVRVIGKGEVARCGDGEGHGIVDPFLKQPVNPGEWFWLIVYPREITSLRHVWSHPAFVDEPAPHVEPAIDWRSRTIAQAQVEEKEDVAVQQSRTWINNFAAVLGLDYDDLMEGASNYLDAGDYLNRGSLLEGERVPEEFWDHYQVVKNEKVEENARGSFFTCSC